MGVCILSLYPKQRLAEPPDQGLSVGAEEIGPCTGDFTPCGGSILEDGSVREWRSRVWTGSDGGTRVEVVIGEVGLWMCWTGGKQELG